MAKKKKITECPHCGSKEGFYTLTDYIGIPYKYGFNGEEKHNGEMYDNARGFRNHRYAHCISCGGIVGTAYSLLKQIER